MPNIADTLADRQKTHGDFTEFAVTAQALKQDLHSAVGWAKLSDVQREAVEMICHKLSRIVNGDPNFLDSYRDIIGYTQLAYNWCEKQQGATDVTNTRKVFNSGSWENTGS